MILERFIQATQKLENARGISLLVILEQFYTSHAESSKMPEAFPRFVAAPHISASP